MNLLAKVALHMMGLVITLLKFLGELMQAVGNEHIARADRADEEADEVIRVAAVKRTALLDTAEREDVAAFRAKRLAADLIAITD